MELRGLLRTVLLHALLTISLGGVAVPLYGQRPLREGGMLPISDRIQGVRSASEDERKEGVKSAPEDNQLKKRKKGKKASEEKGVKSAPEGKSKEGEKSVSEGYQQQKKKGKKASEEKGVKSEQGVLDEQGVPEERSALEEELEQLAADSEEEGLWEDELERLEILRQSPINLNRATRKELEQIPFLSEEQIEQLLAYIYLHGDMQSLNELMAVERMDQRTIQRIRPFVYIAPSTEGGHKFSWKNVTKYGYSQVETRWDIPLYDRKGYEKGEYLGSADYHSIRYRYSYGQQLKVGLTAEKDAGEPFFAQHNKKGYDFYSPYLLLHDVGCLKTLALGNYRLHMGLGLVVGSGFLNGKSYSLTTASFRNNTVSAHSSTDEQHYFQGVAVQLQPLKRVELTAFYSYRPMEGTVKGDTVTSIYKTGLHRSEKEAGKRDALDRQDVGGDLSFRHRYVRVGVSGLYTHFSRPYVHTLPKYARFYAVGRDFYNLSAHYEGRWRSWMLSGESALGKRGYALLHRLDYQWGSGSRMMVVHRLYTHDYWNWYARGFGEGSATQNENGWYMAVEINEVARWRFFGSMDFFSHPWWKYRISKPSQGMDLMTQAAWEPKEGWRVTANYRYKRKERDVTGTSGEIIRPTHQHKGRVRVAYPLLLGEGQTTIDYTHFHSTGMEGGQGWMVTQRLGFTTWKERLTVALQGSYFDSDNYDCRLYASERGLLHTFSFSSFYGQGVRCSLLLRWSYGNLKFLAKWGETRYFNRSTISSGNDLINSNHKDDLQFQLIYKF